MHCVTANAPVNIALIKYWGKRDEELILPVNDSLSMTLCTDEMCAKTSAAASSSFKRHTMWLNGEEVPFEENPRVARCLKEVQRLALAKGNLKFPMEWKLHISSHNNFPTAAGLASSAAGYACLVYTLACLYGVEKEELSAIARQGSGSACRSLNGGFVRWQMGSQDDGSDSIAVPVASSTEWPEMHVLILVVNDGRKKTSSTKGMKLAVETSDLIKYRAKHCVPQRMEAIMAAIKARDFEAFAEITMKDSNQFHAIALDTFPPCVYMNDTSHAIVSFVHALNEKETKVAYTFDAGPNACLYLLEKNVPEVLKALEHSFPNDAFNSVEYLKGIPVEHNLKKEANGFENHISNLHVNDRNLLKYIIHTKVGQGPQQLLDKNEALLDINGQPLGQ